MATNTHSFLNSIHHAMSSLTNLQKTIMYRLEQSVNDEFYMLIDEAYKLSVESNIDMLDAMERMAIYFSDKLAANRIIKDYAMINKNAASIHLTENDAMAKFVKLTNDITDMELDYEQ